MTVSLFPRPQSPGRSSRARTYSPNGALGRQLREAQAIQLEIQELELKLKRYREHFLLHMERNKLNRLELGQFVVQRKVRHNWAYTAETEREALRIRQTQKWEQSQGIAEDTPTVYIAMTTTTPKNDHENA